MTEIENKLERLTLAYAQAQAAPARHALAVIARDLRYWHQRRANTLKQPIPHNSQQVRFGSVVTIELVDGRRQTWRIVGEDEADPRNGSLSYVSPLARGLTGKKTNEIAEVGDASVKIVSIA